MVIDVAFMLYDRPNARKSAQIELHSGATVLELMEKCMELPDMNASLRDLRTSTCLIDGKFRTERHVLEGGEQRVQFVKTAEGG